ncbi:hypothetical protein DFH08DRAFT_1084224 [Mycena albidolilacea]|uniref:Uncharacterized protein n=1 Tax=Mycena albidolilacea TaxID=1033008 RepID=A0AAD6ZN60_9AGAR|nr:hypothetical protein DFH08DRAFT_1084224 [Mycena albidolilacea]
MSASSKRALTDARVDSLLLSSSQTKPLSVLSSPRPAYVSLQVPPRRCNLTYLPGLASVGDATRRRAEPLVRNSFPAHPYRDAGPSAPPPRYILCPSSSFCGLHMV